MRQTVMFLLCSLTAATFSPLGADNQGIVTREGGHFTLNGHPFYYAGCNNYYQMVFAADPSLRPFVDEVQEEAAAMGLTVLRTWAFNDGAGQWNALQLEPGVYDEAVFQGLDYALYRADSLGLRVILPFVNNWDDYGGMNQYVAWSAQTPPASDGFVTVNGTHFELNGAPYYYVGANFWYGMNMASQGPGGDRARLARELDLLADLRITNLRIMAGTEGPDTEPWRMVPSLQVEPGVYNPVLLNGLDFLLKELRDRNLRAVMCLNNFWPWSGGMAQYVSWNGGGAIPYPPPQPGGDWNVYQDYASDFYSNSGAMQDFRDHIAFLINRVNPHTGLAYRDDPTIMAWELANEPRGFHNNAAAFNTWIDDTAAYIKSLDPNHLVTTGCEGDTPWPAWNGLNFEANHNGPHIDYTTIHIWPQNWGWFDPANPQSTYPAAEASARAYFNDHESRAGALGKPMVLEEFGLARDAGSFDPTSTTQYRDTFLAAMFEEVHGSALSSGPAAGDNVWAWAGEGRPLEPFGSYWQPGDPWIGDPPHEQQGWYSIYDCDSTTLAVLAEHALAMVALMGPTEHDDFYQDANCRLFYRNHIAAVLNRVNTFNGRLYREDPTIFAWELANEPRCESDPSGNTLQAWIEEMSAYVKSIDPLHMVTTGSEGFYGPTGPNHNPIGWFGSVGVDFVRNHQPETIDFACVHIWPDWWGMGYAASMAWVSNHIQDTHELLGKPMILEEFGKQRPLETRDLYYQGWFDEIYDAAVTGLPAGGSNFWILYHDAYPDYDGFGVYYPDDASTVAIIETEAARISQLCGGDVDFVRGDFDGSGEINISDPLYNLAYLYAAGPAPTCLDAADTDDSGELDISDPMYNLAYQFTGGPQPPLPFPDCGPDPTADTLDCESFPPCGGAPGARRTTALEDPTTWRIDPTTGRVDATTARVNPTSTPAGSAEEGVFLQPVQHASPETILVEFGVQTPRELAGFEFTAAFDGSVLEWLRLEPLSDVDFDFLSGAEIEGASAVRVGGVPDLRLQVPLEPGRHLLGTLQFRARQPAAAPDEILSVATARFVYADRRAVVLEGGVRPRTAPAAVRPPATGTPAGTPPALLVPNPYRVSSAIELSIPRGSRVEVAIFDVSGRRVRTLLNGVVRPGQAAVCWDGTADDGNAVNAGVYYVQAQLGDVAVKRQILLVR